MTCDVWYVVICDMWYVLHVTCGTTDYVIVCDMWCSCCLCLLVTHHIHHRRSLGTPRTAPCPGLCLLTFGLSFYLMISSQSSFLQHSPISQSLWNQLGKSLNVAFNNTESNGAMHVFDCMKIFTINILIIEERNTKQFRKWWL